MVIGTCRVYGSGSLAKILTQLLLFVVSVLVDAPCDLVRRVDLGWFRLHFTPEVHRLSWLFHGFGAVLVTT